MAHWCAENAAKAYLKTVKMVSYLVFLFSILFVSNFQIFLFSIIIGVITISLD